MDDTRISETQRKYFAQRINEEFNREIALMRQQEATGIDPDFRPTWDPNVQTQAPDPIDALRGNQ